MAKQRNPRQHDPKITAYIQFKKREGIACFQAASLEREKTNQKIESRRPGLLKGFANSELEF
jgi:hypothetical protein